MPLRDTLNRLREQQQETDPALDRPRLLAEWKQAADELFQQIRHFLSEYERDGSLSVTSRRVRLKEAALGTYEISALRIQAGPAVIFVQPVALDVSGAQGRVDMHRQGRPAEEDRAILLRRRESEGNAEFGWFVFLPRDIRDPWERRYSTMPVPRKLLPLSKEVIEQAIDILLS